MKRLRLTKTRRGAKRMRLPRDRKGYRFRRRISIIIVDAEQLVIGNEGQRHQTLAFRFYLISGCGRVVPILQDFGDIAAIDEDRIEDAARLTLKTNGAGSHLAPKRTA